MCLEDLQFLKAAETLLIDTEVSSSQQETFVTQLRTGYSKLYVLREMSIGFRRDFQPGRLPGLRRRLSLYKWSRLPLLGGIVRLVAGLPSESTTQKRIRALETQVYLLAKTTPSHIISSLGPCPWGGEHRKALLDHITNIEEKLTPTVSTITHDLLGHVSKVAKEGHK